MDKKKLISNELQSWHWFIPLFAIVFVMFSFILSGSSYASMSYDTLCNAIDKCNELNNSQQVTYPDINDIQSYLTNYDNVVVAMQSTNNFYLGFGYQYFYLNANYIGSTNMNNNYLDVIRCTSGNITSLELQTFYFGSSYASKCAFTSDIYTDNTLTNISKTANVVVVPPAPQNTITLNAGLNSFHRYQGVGDKEQLIVYLDGYVTEDFTFFVEQYIDNEWQIATGINDYYFLYDEQNNDIYRNPYYITFTYLSGLPAGTSRYVALLNDNPETAFHSDNFIITPWSIGNDATGTVDSNGDIDINIDTGNTVEGIADFLSQDPTVTQEQFSDNFPTVEVDDPSEDFFSWIFDQIENIFTSTTAQTLQFELFGTTYSYSSNDVYVPNNALKTMIGLSCDFSICMWIIKDVRKVINKIKEGNIEALSDEDITANMV